MKYTRSTTATKSLQRSKKVSWHKTGDIFLDQWSVMFTERPAHHNFPTLGVNISQYLGSICIFLTLGVDISQNLGNICISPFLTLNESFLHISLSFHGYLSWNYFRLNFSTLLKTIRRGLVNQQSISCVLKKGLCCDVCRFYKHCMHNWTFTSIKACNWRLY